MTRFSWVSLLLGGLLVSLLPAQTQLENDEQSLRNHRLPTDMEGLITFFQQRSLKEGDEKQLEQLVRELGSNAYQVREPAAKKLEMRGPAALPFLKNALKNTPLETKRRA